MHSEFERILAVLERYIPSASARALLIRAAREHGCSPERLGRDEVRRCSASIWRRAAHFINPEQRQAAMQDIGRACGSNSLKPGGCAMQIEQELDIGRARAEARRICEAAGATGFAMQKVATIVSELARNMVLYANGGELEILWKNMGAERIVVRASDNGPGIRNLDEILSGRYKSKTGLGRGLFGTKRLADDFEISSSASGTKVVVEVAL